MQTKQSCQPHLNVRASLLQNEILAAVEQKARPEVILLIKLKKSISVVAIIIIT